MADRLSTASITALDNMPTESDNSGIQTSKVFVPDYAYTNKSGKTYHAGYYNRNIQVYDIHSDGRYIATVHIPLCVPDNEAEAAALYRFRKTYSKAWPKYAGTKLRAHYVTSVIDHSDREKIPRKKLQRYLRALYRDQHS